MASPKDQVPLPKSDGSSVVLWVGSADIGQVMADRIASLVDAPDLKFLPVAQSRVTPMIIKDLCPSVAFSLLTWTNGDALETAMRLKACGFSGSYRALSQNLPDRNIIEREIRILVPDLDFAVMEIDPATD